MRSTDDRRTSSHAASVSLILPVPAGSALAGQAVVECRRVLKEESGFDSIEVIVVRSDDDPSENGQAKEGVFLEDVTDLATRVPPKDANWPMLVRAGLGVAKGEYLVVLDLNRPYDPQSLVPVLSPVRAGQTDLAIAVPLHGPSGLAGWVRSLTGAGYLSRLLLGTSDVSSGLFALRRGAWDADFKHGPTRGSSLVLDSLVRRHTRSVDVPVPVGTGFQTEHLGFKDLRQLKRILDRRFGNYSRLVQFCIVGASGMVVDLTSYALLQYLLSLTWLARQNSTLAGGSWHLAIAAGTAIVIALVWNFTLNRKLTFNDAAKGALVRQFLTYVLSNAVAIILSFSVRLYLPAHVAFFARHRLAAAVVGIVAATGISFSMSRWLVFGRRPELKRSSRFPLEPSPVGQPTSVP